MALTTIDDRGLKTPIDLIDNEKIRFGTGNDLEIYHDGSESFVTEGTGDLNIKTTASGKDIGIRSADDLFLMVHTNESALIARGDGAVELYHNNEKKLETIANGVQTNGSHFVMDGDGANGNPKFACGNGADLNIYHDGSNSHIHQDGTGDLQIRSDNSIEFNTNGTENAIWCDINGAVKLYYDNDLKFKTTSGGVDITGTGTNTVEINGTGDHELYSYHDASGAGWATGLGGTFGELVYLNEANSVVAIYAAGETSAKFVGNGAAELRYDDVKKLETASTGVQITGYLGFESTGKVIHLADSRELVFGTGEDLKIYHDGNSYIKDAGTGDLIIDVDSAVRVAYDGRNDWEFGDAFLKGKDNRFIKLGDSNDLMIHHQTSYPRNVIESNGCDLVILATPSSGTNEKGIAVAQNAQVELFYDNSKKLETSSTGATVTGIVDADAFTGTADTAFKYVVSTQGDTNIPHNTYTTIQSDYGWVLPAAGTYLLSSSMRVRMWGVTGLIQCRLYDTTNSSVISSPDSTRMMWEDQNGDTRNVQITLTWIHTCSGAVTINQQFSTSNNSNNSSIQNDGNGRNYAYWQRIG